MILRPRYSLVALFIAVFFIHPVYAGDTDSPEPVNYNLEASMKIMEALSARLQNNTDLEQTLFHEALDLYNEGLAKNPDDIKLLKGRGLVMDKLEDGSGDADFEQVIALATERIETEPDHAYSYYHRAAAYRSLQQYDNARADYKKAIELNPKKENWPMDLKSMEIEAKGSE